MRYLLMQQNHVSDMSQAWFYVATSISHFYCLKWDARLCHHKARILRLILRQKMGMFGQ